MIANVTQLNLIVAWLWVVLGFVTGFAMGLNFHREDWLGGYGSFRRRLYRLGHISFFGLGAVNLMFYFTAQHFSATHPLTAVASWGFVLGAVTMPLCCFLMAHNARTRALFLIPVVSLLIGALVTLALVAYPLNSRNSIFPPENSARSRFPLTPAIYSENGSPIKARPHPGPLPQERENRRQSVGESGAVGNFTSRALLFPLPEGEGHGEGEPVSISTLSHAFHEIRFPKLYQPSTKRTENENDQSIVPGRVRAEPQRLHDYP